MITKLFIENFRSIENAEMDLGKITVLTGANNSGKSSVIYALLVLRNILTNPNQSLDNILTLPFINLGGFEQVVYLKDKEKSIKLGFSIDYNMISIGGISFDFPIKSGDITFSCSTNPAKTDIQLDITGDRQAKGVISIAFPYTLNKSAQVKFVNNKYDDSSWLFLWNGFNILPDSIKPIKPVLNSKNVGISLDQQKSIEFFTTKPSNTMNSLDFVPIRRGFSKPFYSPVPLSSNRGITEEEIATIISLDRELISQIAHYLEKIVDRQFSIYTTPNTAIFYLQTRHKATGFTTDLVNEGLGTNQLVTILAKVLQKDSDIVCIDEPEIHLHPSVISKLVGVLVEIANKEKKQFIVSTHSEHFITALLKHIRQDDIKNEDVKVYYLKKEGQKTVIENQPINEKGQIEGGLVHFYETELEDLSSLFNITD